MLSTLQMFVRTTAAVINIKMFSVCRLLLMCCLVHLTLADDSCPGLPLCFCNKAKTSVNCEGKGFTSVPPNIPVTAEKIYFNNNKISTITTRAFGNLPNLQRIWLKGNLITVIEPFGFGNLSALSYVDLSSNKLVEIGDNAFSNVSNLNILLLVTNSIQRVNKKAFIGTSAITYISLQANKMTSIPWLENMPLLQKLILEGNQITNATFPECYKRNKHLSYIGLSNNVIVTLSNDTFVSLRNNSISSLYLSRNNIKTVEAEAFAPLGSIKSLKLGSNPLDAQALRTAIAGLKQKDMVSFDLSAIKLNGELLVDTFKMLQNTSITTLNLNNNKIQSLPNGVFSGLNKLLHLDLTSCSIHETNDESFKGLDKLSILILNNNRLQDVPNNLPRTLINLYMDKNQITMIEDNVFANLVNLQELRVRDNQILTLKQNSFFGLVNLSKLKLNYNNIATIPSQLFDSMVHLLSLDLSNNNLIQVQYSKDRFSSLGSLLYFSLANNQLQYFQTDLFKYTTSLRFLHLEGNSIGSMIAEDFGGELFKGLSNLEQLYLMNNNIMSIPEPSFQDLASLKLLNLTNNKMTGWGKELFRSTQKLEALDFTNNLISTLKADNVGKFRFPMNLNLTGNPFLCDCDLRWFRDWMNKTEVELSNNSSYICHEPKDWSGKPLLSFSRDKINCLFFKWYVILISCTCAVTVVAVVAIFVYRKRWKIKLMWYKRTRRMRKRIGKVVAADGRGNYGAIEDEEGQEWFDAYISCSEEDKHWVLTNLLPIADRGQLDDNVKFEGQYNLYFEDRNAEAGRSLAGNIFENMCISRKVLVILSQHYLKSPIHMFELDLAIDKMYDHELERVVVIHIDNGLPKHKIPKRLIHTMIRHKMIEWTEDEDNKELFKAQINEILASHERAVDFGTE
ncbi:Toll-like receptor 5 [Mactra antiquata]